MMQASNVTGTALLFPGALQPTDTPGPFASVALEDALDKLLDYSVPSNWAADLRIGQRVAVPLGKRNRPRFGYVVGIRQQTDYPKIKPLLAIDDRRVLVPAPLLALARWMSRYYCTPLGTVIDSIIPSAVKKRIGVGRSYIVRMLKTRKEIQELLEKVKATKRRSVLARLLQIEGDEGIELHRLAGEAGTTATTVRKLVKLGLISITRQMDAPTLPPPGDPLPPAEPAMALNEDQQKAFDALIPCIRDSGFSVSLLKGVTGSGKTEVYLQCIAGVVQQGRQAIVMVPEIALTPQTVRRFTARFTRVAILHSGLSAGERHRFWQQTATGMADVVVGARSAVFAPLPRLGMIVVDEEHEASYKQDSAPRYHGRDVAIKRAQLENVPVLLGSATPSLEMFWRVTQGRVPKMDQGNEAPVEPSPPLYQLLQLPRRVRGLEMPAVELLDMKQEMRRRKGIHLVSQRLEDLLKQTIARKQQAILLLNRRGYSGFVYCVSCQQAVQCKYCDATMTYHRSAGAQQQTARWNDALHTGQLHCHYCLAIQPLPQTCPECGKKLTLFGLGTQRVEEELNKKFPDVNFARVDSDTMRNSKDYEALLSRFGRGEVQVMLGTQMIAKGLDYPNVTLVGVINGDTALSLPDFRAAERTFQLITQVAGRAGRGSNPGRVVLQTFMPDDPTIRSALKQDYDGFARPELARRQEVLYPPFGRLVRIVLRDQDVEKLNTLSEVLAYELNKVVEIINREGFDVAAKGPMPCTINRIAGYWRQQIVMKATQGEGLQRVLAELREKKAFARSERIAVDVDPVSLL